MHHRPLLLLPALLTGCALEASPPASSPSTHAQPLVIQPPTPAPAQPAAPEAVRRPVARFERAELDWSAVSAHPALDVTWLSPVQRAKIDAAPLPLLLPADEALVRAAHVSAGPRWGAWHVQADGVTIRMHATDAVVEVPELEISAAGEAQLGRPYTLTRNHQIVTITFNRFGGGYAMDVECARPMTDARCVEDAFALGLFHKLAVAPRGGVR